MAFEKKTLEAEQSLRFFKQEVKAAFQAASKYCSNYHAWDYRHFLLETWLSNGDVPADVKSEILKSEKEVSDTWLNSHISDYCGYHYRQMLLCHMVRLELNVEESKVLLQVELKENRGMILFYPGHESLWYHRKILIKQYAGILGNSKSSEVTSLLEGEQNLVEAVTIKPRENGDDKYNNFSISDGIQLNHTYSERHLRWIKTFLG